MIFDIVKDEVHAPLVCHAVGHHVLRLVVQLHDRARVEGDLRHGGLIRSHEEVHIVRVGEDGQMTSMSVPHPIARVMVHGDGHAWRHGGQQAAHHLTLLDADGFVDRQKQRSPLVCTRPRKI